MSRCGKCMKLYPLYYYNNHRCKTEDFLKKINVQPNYKNSINRVEEYKLRVCFNRNENLSMFESMFLCQKRFDGN